jgi:hypothetical protein
MQKMTNYNIRFDAADQCDLVADRIADHEKWLDYVEEVMGSWLMETQEGYRWVWEEISLERRFEERMMQVTYELGAKPIRDENHKSQKANDMLAIIEEATESVIKQHWDSLYRIVKEQGWLDA